MEVRTALIADPNEDVALALAKVLQPDFRVIHCADGREALTALIREQPALLITELSLPRLDGIALLRELSRREQQPCVLVYTIDRLDFALYALQELPVDYIMRKPTPAAIVAERIREMLQPRPMEPISWTVADILIRLSISEGTQGYRHLLVGLPLLAEQSEQFLGKTLYLEIARQNRVTPQSVEKAIRDAIHGGWSRGDRSFWRHYFPGADQAPRNKEFLTRMAGVLCRQRKCG